MSTEIMVEVSISSDDPMDAEVVEEIAAEIAEAAQTQKRLLVGEPGEIRVVVRTVNMGRTR